MPSGNNSERHAGTGPSAASPAAPGAPRAPQDEHAYEALHRIPPMPHGSVPPMCVLERAALQRQLGVLCAIDEAVRQSGLDGEGVEGLYGSITWRSQLALTRALRRLGLWPRGPGGRAPSVVDFGAGTGRSLLLWLCLGLAGRAWGYEVDAVKVAKAAPYAHRVIRASRGAQRGLGVCAAMPGVEHCPVEQVNPRSLAFLAPTIGYSFWVGLTAAARQAIARHFLACTTMQVLVLIDRGTTSAEAILSRLCLAEGSDEARRRRQRERREAAQQQQQQQQGKRRRLGPGAEAGEQEAEWELEKGWQRQRWGRQQRAGCPGDAAQPFDVPYPVPCPARVVRKVTGLKALGGSCYTAFVVCREGGREARRAARRWLEALEEAEAAEHAALYGSPAV